MLSVQDRKIYRLRFKNSSFAEIIYRSKELFLIWLLKHRLFSPNNLQTCKLSQSFFNTNLKMPFFQCNISQDNITELLKDKIPALNAYKPEFSQIENQIKESFFSTINYRNSMFDIRAIWEPARLQSITTLFAYLSMNTFGTNSDRIKKFCADEIISWIQNNPFLYGPHYISVMECGLRIPVLFYSLKLLDNLQQRQIKLILNTIFLHAWWISKRLSLYSSLGNHTIAECIGLIFAGALFRENKFAKKWLNNGIKLLIKGLPFQILDDGGPAEQSFHYHRFVLDLYWLAINFLERNKIRECFKLKPLLIRAEKFLMAFKVQNGHLPSIGDSDDGFAVAPGIEPEKPIINYSKKKVRIFKKSGYTVISSSNGVQLIFDHGPLGMAPLYNHGHADALSIILNLKGKPILVDPGTYKYNDELEWRHYFKGTRAHNTITIDECDQSVQETGFNWSHPYDVKLLGFSESADQIMIDAMHDGYTRLKEGVRHKRGILFFNNNCFLIKDSFIGEGVHEFEINFHLHPDTRMIKKNSWWQISNGEAQIYMGLLEAADFSIIQGSINPIHGWYSPYYGIKLKCDVLSCKKKGSAHDVSFVTAICTGALIGIKKIQEKLVYFD